MNKNKTIIYFGREAVDKGLLSETIEFAKSKNLESIEVYAESSDEVDREEILDLMQDWSHAKTFVVYSLDQLDLVGSNTKNFLGFIQTLAKNNVRFISLKDSLDTKENTQQFMSKVIDAIKNARETIRGRNIQKALAKNKILGHSVGRPRQINYDAIKKYRKEGLSINAISEKLKISRGTVLHCLKLGKLDEGLV